jgi:hypothetical protein
MSMSEFEKEWDDQRIDSSLLLRQELGLPEDFTDEDMAFAQEMDTLFSLDTEEMPPYYVQTLLDSENPRLQPAAHGLEYKTLAHVFRRLKLRRRLFRSKRATFSFVTQVRHVRLHRSMLAVLAACCLFVFYSGGNGSIIRIRPRSAALRSSWWSTTGKWVSPSVF